jgi:hypothetical protein
VGREVICAGTDVDATDASRLRQLFADAFGADVMSELLPRLRLLLEGGERTVAHHDCLELDVRPAADCSSARSVRCISPRISCWSLKRRSSAIVS